MLDGHFDSVIMEIKQAKSTNPRQGLLGVGEVLGGEGGEEP
jgi:hypothetical protein